MAREARQLLGTRLSRQRSSKQQKRFNLATTKSIKPSCFLRFYLDNPDNPTEVRLDNPLQVLGQSGQSGQSDGGSSGQSVSGSWTIRTIRRRFVRTIRHRYLDNPDNPDNPTEVRADKLLEVLGQSGQSGQSDGGSSGQSVTGQGETYGGAPCRCWKIWRETVSSVRIGVPTGWRRKNS